MLEIVVGAGPLTRASQQALSPLFLARGGGEIIVCEIISRSGFATADVGTVSAYLYLYKVQ